LFVTEGHEGFSQVYYTFLPVQINVKLPSNP